MSMSLREQLLAAGLGKKKAEQDERRAKEQAERRAKEEGDRRTREDQNEKPNKSEQSTHMAILRP